jgi:hypothetical protein
MNDRPSAEELLEAVGRFLADEAVPGLEGHLKYQARVAANVVRIVARELALSDEHARAEWQRLAALLGDDAPMPETRAARTAELLARNARLVDRIREGGADAGPWRTEVLDHLKRTTADKLAVALGPSKSSG